MLEPKLEFFNLLLIESCIRLINIIRNAKHFNLDLTPDNILIKNRKTTINY